MIPKIAFFDTKPYDREFFEKKNPEFGFEIKFFKPHLSAETAPLTKGFDAVCVFVNDTLDAEVIRELEWNGVKLIALRSAGYNNVDLKAAINHIRVVRVPAYSPYAVAEHAAALILGLNRKTHRAYSRTRDYNFTLNGLMGFDLNGKTLGIIGTGKIGQILIKISRGLGMRVLAGDPFPNEKLAQELDFTYVDMDSLFREADVISLHCPLTPQNLYMINAETIAKMKPGVMLINTGRGKLIDSLALVEGLKSGKIGAAGLDVYEEETDYFFEDFSNSVMEDDVLARLLSFPNVLITSHQAFFTREAVEKIVETTLNNIKLFFENQTVPNEICYQCGQNCGGVNQGKCRE